MQYWRPMNFKITLIIIGLLLSVKTTHATELCKANLSSTVSLEEFLKNPKMDGSVPFPIGYWLEFNMQVEGDKEAFHLAFQIGRISELPLKYRRLAKDLKARTKAMTVREMEWAAIIVEYEDGVSQGIKLTSRMFGEVTTEDFEKAFAESKIANNGKKITRFTHIHTHSNPKNIRKHLIEYIPPSDVDLIEYKRLRQQLLEINPNVIFDAYVLPSCEFCEELVFIVDDEMLDKFQVL